MVEFFCEVGFCVVAICVVGFFCLEFFAGSAPFDADDISSLYTFCWQFYQSAR